MSDLDANIRLTATNEAEGVLRQLASQIRDASTMSNTAISTQINAELTKTIDHLNAVGKVAEEHLGKQMKKATQEASIGVGELFKTLAGGVAIEQFVRKGVEGFSSVQRGMTRIGLETNLTKQQLETLHATMEKLRARTGESMDQLTKSFQIFQAFSQLPAEQAAKLFERITTAAYAMGTSSESMARAAAIAVRELKVPASELNTVLEGWNKSVSGVMFEPFLQSLGRMSTALASINLTGADVAINLGQLFATMPDKMAPLEAMLQRAASMGNALGIQMRPQFEAIVKGGGNATDVLLEMYRIVQALGAYEGPTEQASFVHRYGVTPEQLLALKQAAERLIEMRKNAAGAKDEIKNIDDKAKELDQNLKAAGDRLSAAFWQTAEAFGHLMNTDIAGVNVLSKITDSVNDIRDALTLLQKYLSGSGIEWEKWLGVSEFGTRWARMEQQMRIYKQWLIDIAGGWILSDSPEMQAAKKKMEEIDKKLDEILKKKSGTTNEQAYHFSGGGGGGGDNVYNEPGYHDAFLPDAPMSSNIEDRRQGEEQIDELSKNTQEVKRLADLMDQALYGPRGGRQGFASSDVAGPGGGRGGQGGMGGLPGMGGPGQGWPNVPGGRGGVPPGSQRGGTPGQPYPSGQPPAAPHYPGPDEGPWKNVPYPEGQDKGQPGPGGGIKEAYGPQTRGAMGAGTRDIVEYAARKQGLDVEAFSGNRGSGRHGPQASTGPAADVYLTDPKTGQRITPDTPEGQAKIAQFIEDSAAAGATGIGHGPGYMGPGIHVGGTAPGAPYEGTWGAGGRSANSPKWVREAYERGRARAMTPEQRRIALNEMRGQQGPNPDVKSAMPKMTPMQQQQAWNKTALPDGSVPATAGMTATSGPGADIYNKLKAAYEQSGLVGSIPPGGEKFGFTTGSADEWARFGTAVANAESGFNPRSSNTSDPGGSFGIFQYAHKQVPGGNAFDVDASIEAFVRDSKDSMEKGIGITGSKDPSGSILDRRFAVIGNHPERTISRLGQGYTTSETQTAGPGAPTQQPQNMPPVPHLGPGGRPLGVPGEARGPRKPPPLPEERFNAGEENTPSFPGTQSARQIRNELEGRPIKPRVEQSAIPTPRPRPKDAPAARRETKDDAKAASRGHAGDGVGFA